MLLDVRCGVRTSPPRSLGMLSIPIDDPRAVALTAAIHAGDVDALDTLLRAAPELATGRVVDARGVARTLLHLVADWPGHFPNGAPSVARIIAAGAEPSAPLFTADPHGPRETPLHWAASSDDVAVLDALLDGGADIEAAGGAFTGGAAMSNAVVFAQWRAARRLLERGATTTIWQAAALGLLDRVQQHVAAVPPPVPRDITNAFWHACRGGQRAVAEFLLERGADLQWIGHDRKTPLDAARASGNADLVEWLRARSNVGARR